MSRLRFVLRELVHSGQQAAVFVLCVVLSLSTLVALNTFKKSVDASILGDARALHGGDILIHSHYPFGQRLEQMVADLERHDHARIARTYQFYTMIRPMKGDGTLFCRLKAVSPGYPLYGRIKLRSHRPFTGSLGHGRVVVAPEVLQRLGLKVGDKIHIGRAVVTISDVVTFEPDRPVEIFSLGPEILISTDDLPKLQLVGLESRVEYAILIKTYGSEARIKDLAAGLRQAARPVQDRITTYFSAGSRMKGFFDNLFFFLSLITIFTLLLAGIGMQTSQAALLREKEKTLAVLKAIGAKGGFLFRRYFTLTLYLGLIGSSIGIGAGQVLARLLPRLFHGLLPPGTTMVFSVFNGLEYLALGLLVVFFFTFLPLSGLHRVRPTAIFRHEHTAEKRGVLFYLTAFLGLVLVTLAVIHQLKDPKVGLYFVAGAAALIVVLTLSSRLMLAAAGRIPIASLTIRQAARSLLRPGNATLSIMVTLASALSVLLTIYLVQANLGATYIKSYPPDAPNLFFIDIQPDQRQAFAHAVGADVRLFPIVRARLVAINGKPVRQHRHKGMHEDNLTREFNLTYRNQLLPDEVLRTGSSLFKKDAAGKIPLQVSILDTVAKMGDMHLGDLLKFNIQGVPLTARVTSIRGRTKSRLYPFFYFVFPTKYLKDAPQTFFAALHLDKKAIAPLEDTIARTFPNISFINMADAASELGRLAAKLIRIINFFAAFSILAGILIMVGSIFATRIARIREAVYYKVLGAGSRFVLSMFLAEHLILGLVSAILAAIVAEAGSWALCRYLFDIGFSPHWQACLFCIAATGVVVGTVGVLSSIGIIRQRPAIVLREQNEE